MRNKHLLVIVSLIAVAFGLYLWNQSSSGPITTTTSSSSFSTLNDKAEFLNRYVTFRRNYRDLEFHITYLNNSGIVTAPSEWDIRLITIVPEEELNLWIPAGIKATTSVDRDWLTKVPSAHKADGIAEWYVEQGKVVGVNRQTSVVAYRAWKQ